MKTVICIEEECHGLIGIVNEAKDIVPYLIDHGWIDQETTIELLDNKKQWCNIPLKNLFGENWVKTFSIVPLDILSEIFNDSFDFLEKEVYCAEFY